VLLFWSNNKHFATDIQEFRSTTGFEICIPPAAQAVHSLADSELASNTTIEDADDEEDEAIMYAVAIPTAPPPMISTRRLGGGTPVDDDDDDDTSCCLISGKTEITGNGG
jgi:hypothetical protein